MLITLPTEPHRIAADTFLVPTLAAEPAGAFVGVHSLVIRGSEPVIVDTGASLARDAWMEQVHALVDPHDVRWIFLSHDDHDHIGNLLPMLDACPAATLVCNFSIASRLAGDVELPIHRMRWVDAGGSFEAGDRTLQVVRPPLFDSPATRGLFDPTTGVLWAVDSFATLVPGAVHEAADVPVELYTDSFTVLNGGNSPWLEWLDRDRFAAHVARTATLPIEVLASAHGPVHRGDHVAEAFRRTLDLVGEPAAPSPGQDLLDQLLGSVFVPAVAA